VACLALESDRNLDNYPALERDRNLEDCLTPESDRSLGVFLTQADVASKSAKIHLVIYLDPESVRNPGDCLTLEGFKVSKRFAADYAV
jgi:hypothetical protein